MRWDGHREQHDERHTGEASAHHDADGELPLMRECDLLVMQLCAQQLQARLGDAQQLVEERLTAAEDWVGGVAHSSSPIASSSFAPKELAKIAPRINPNAVAPPTTVHGFSRV